MCYSYIEIRNNKHYKLIINNKNKHYKLEIITHFSMNKLY